MVSVVDSIDLIAACMPDFGAVELGRESSELHIALPIPLVDGRVPVFELIISVVGLSPSAREAKPGLLPPFCPDRHINEDGSFCLYWRAVDDIAIEGPDAARNWWETLVRFLQMQFRAARLRRWPDGGGRAHGAAAIHQYWAEQAADRLGAPYPMDLADCRLTTERSGGSAEGVAIRVLRDGKRIFAVWQRSRRVVNLRRPCLCLAGSVTRPAVLRSCRDHAEAAATLAVELNNMVVQEKIFWNTVKNRSCCGTMLNCPLAAAM